MFRPPISSGLWQLAHPTWGWSGLAAETADLARDLARQANTYKDLAYTDTLSGLPNRRAFEDRAARLSPFSDAKPLAVLMIDLDGFKPVNDSEGHEAGDRILALMARAVAGGLREGDFVARFGGDEVAALLPHTDRRRTSLSTRPRTWGIVTSLAP